MKQKLLLFTINLLTISRFGLGGLFYHHIFAKQDRYLWCLVLFFFVVFSDWLDGKLARYCGLTTHGGAMLDVFADLFFVMLSHFGLYQLGMLPIWAMFGMLLKFLEFMITSHLFPKSRKNGHPLWFDKLGKGLALVFYSFPMFAVTVMEMTSKDNAKILFYVVWLFLLGLTGISIVQRLHYSIKCRKQDI